MQWDFDLEDIQKSSRDIQKLDQDQFVSLALESIMTGLVDVVKKKPST